MKREYFKNLIFSYSPFVAHITITIAIIPYAVARMGELQYGLLILFHTMLGYLAMANLGTPQALIRKLIHYQNKDQQEEASSLLSSFFYFFVVVVLLLVALVLLVVSFDLFGIISNLTSEQVGSNLLIKLTLLLLTIFAFDLIRQLFDSVILSKNMVYLSKLLLALLILARGICLFLALVMGGGLISILICYTVLAVLFALLYLLQAHDLLHFNLKLSSFNFSNVKELLPDSFWYFIGSFSMLLLYQVDIIIVSKYIGIAAVTGFAILFRYVDVITRMISNIVTVLFPKIAQLYSSGRYHDLKKLYDKMMLVMIASAIFILVPFYFLGELIFKLWMGNLDLWNSELFLILISFNIIVLLTTPSIYFLNAVGWHRFSTKLGLVRGGINIVLSIILVKQYGVVGIALGTFLAFAITSFIFNNIYFRSKINALIANENS